MLEVAQDRQDLNSEEDSSSPGAKAKKTESSESRVAEMQKTRRLIHLCPKTSKSVKKSPAKVAKPTDSKLEAMYQKWSVLQ